MRGEDAVCHDGSVFLRPFHVEPVAVIAVAQHPQRAKQRGGQARKVAELPTAFSMFLKLAKLSKLCTSPKRALPGTLRPPQP